MGSPSCELADEAQLLVNRGTIVPTPAAAPSISHIRRAGRQLQGVLKAVKDDSNDTYYVKYDKAKPFCSLTRDAAEALRVRCNSLSDATLLEPIVSHRLTLSLLRDMHLLIGQSRMARVTRGWRFSGDCHHQNGERNLLSIFSAPLTFAALLIKMLQICLHPGRGDREFEVFLVHERDSMAAHDLHRFDKR